MAVVNSILTKVDMSTEKYKKKLQGIKKDTKSATNGMAQSFASIGSAWKAAIAGISAGALTGAISKELQATEKGVASFITATGNLKDARAQFELLQQAARDTIQPFDNLKNVALELRKNGIEVTAERLKTFSQIAYATGISIDEVGKSFTDALHGKSEGFEKLGVTAKDTGTTMALTYKGVTKEIEKNSDALMEYYKELGKENEGVLDYLQGGMTGALNQADNAWGDFTRAIAETGFGQLIADGIREGADALDGLTAWLNENQPYFSEFFSELSSSFRAVTKALKSTLSDATDYVGKFFSDSGDNAKEGLENIAKYFTHFFEFSRIGFSEYIAKPASMAWDALKGGANATGNWLGTLFATGDLSKASASYNKTLNQAADEMMETSKLWNKAIQFQWGDVAEADKRIKNSLEEQTKKLKLKLEYEQALSELKKNYLASKPAYKAEYLRAKQILEADYARALKELGENAPSPEVFKPIKFKETGTGTRSKKTSTNNVKSVKDHTDQMLAQWKSYYASLQSAHDDLTLSDAQKLDQKYADELAKLEEFHAAALISEEQYQNALTLLKANKAIEIEQYKNEALEKYREQSKAQAGKVNSLGINEDDFNHMRNGLDDLGDAFANLGESMSKSSSSYKAVFAMQKAFSVASATLNCISAWAKALGTSTTWYESLANYASAIAMTTSIMSQIKQVNMYDKGGKIPSGQLGIVGEYGPEIIQGPANVTSRKDTAKMLNKNGYTNITVNVVEDSSKAGNVETKETDEETIINVFVSDVRKGGGASQALQSTFGLKRVGM